MQSFLLLLPDFALIALGVALRRFAGLGDGFWPGAERLVYFVLFPALLFHALARVSIDLTVMGPLFAVGLLTMAGGLVLGFLGRPLLGPGAMSFASRVQAARGSGGANGAVVAAVVARLAPNVDAQSVGQTVRQWKHLSALTQTEQEEILIKSVVDKARKQIGLFLAILLTVSAVVIALIIYTMTMEKLKQIATLKLIGAPDRTIVGLILQQSLALGVVGLSLGLALIMTVKDYFPRRVLLEPFNALALTGIILVVCVLASGTPAC